MASVDLSIEHPQERDPPRLRLARPSCFVAAPASQPRAARPRRRARRALSRRPGPHGLLPPPRRACRTLQCLLSLTPLSWRHHTGCRPSILTRTSLLPRRASRPLQCPLSLYLFPFSRRRHTGCRCQYRPSLLTRTSLFPRRASRPLRCPLSLRSNDARRVDRTFSWQRQT